MSSLQRHAQAPRGAGQRPSLLRRLPVQSNPFINRFRCLLCFMLCVVAACVLDLQSLVSGETNGAANVQFRSIHQRFVAQTANLAASTSRKHSAAWPAPACDNVRYNYFCDSQPSSRHVKCTNGLGNRLGCLWEALVLARRFCIGAELHILMHNEYILLKKGPCPDCEFAAHFHEIDGVRIYEASEDPMPFFTACGTDQKSAVSVCQNERAAAPWTAHILRGKALSTTRQQCYSTRSAPPLRLEKNISLLHQLPCYVVDAVSAIQLLRPRAHIAEPVANMSRRWRLREFGVGVHVRRTDRVKGGGGRASAVNAKEDARQLREMAQALEREPRTVFYLAVDNVLSQQMFEEAFPGRVQYYERLEMQPDAVRQTTTKHALIDLFALAECRDVILSPKSSFGDLVVGLQCARSNGTVGWWCAGRKMTDRISANVPPELYGAYERALLEND